ncbi:MAG: protein-L-isoaspartate O-methyltransferase [Pseudomonadota bacterium]
MSGFEQARTTMVDTQVRPSDVTRYPIIAAMLGVPRENYVPSDARAVAYADSEIEIARGRLMPAPRTVAKMLDTLELNGSELVLLIGSGTGYSAALLSRLAEAVIAVEEDDDLARSSAQQLSDDGADTVLVEHRPLTEGAPEHGPYDVIFVEGGVAELPQGLTDQLRQDGKIVMLRCDGPLSYAEFGVKGTNDISTRRLFDATARILPGFSRDQTFIF